MVQTENAAKTVLEFIFQSSQYNLWQEKQKKM